MTQFLRGAGAIALLAIAWLAIQTAMSVRAITISTVSSENAIATAAAAVPGIVDARLVSLQASVDGAVRTTDARLASIQDDAREQLTAANRELSIVTRAAAETIPETASSVTKSIASISTDLHQVAVPAASLAAQLNDAAPLYLDCDHNPSCAYNFFQGTAKSIQQSSQAIAKAAPQMAESAAKIEGHIDGITGNVDRVVDQITKPKRWYLRLLTWL